MSGRSYRAAIDAKCKSCIYDPGSGNGTWREQVEACSSSNCPLHRFRPISRPKTRGQWPKAIRHGPGTVLRFDGPQIGLPGPTVAHSQGGAP